MLAWIMIRMHTKQGTNTHTLPSKRTITKVATSVAGVTQIMTCRKHRLVTAASGAAMLLNLVYKNVNIKRLRRFRMYVCVYEYCTLVHITYI